jgi:hypothetical protein
MCGHVHRHVLLLPFDFRYVFTRVILARVNKSIVLGKSAGNLPCSLRSTIASSAASSFGFAGTALHLQSTMPELLETPLAGGGPVQCA